MKTLQKIIWTLFLIFGLISNSNCRGEVDYLYKTDYVYKNNSNLNLKLKLINNENIIFEEYQIEKGAEKTISLQEDGDKNGICQPFRLQNDTRYIATKVIIEFDNNTCISFENGFGLLDYKSYDNYNSSMKNNSYNSLIFNFDSEEVNLAKPCQ